MLMFQKGLARNEKSGQPSFLALQLKQSSHCFLQPVALFLGAILSQPHMEWICKSYFPLVVLGGYCDCISFCGSPFPVLVYRALLVVFTPFCIAHLPNPRVIDTSLVL